MAFHMLLAALTLVVHASAGDPVVARPDQAYAGARKVELDDVRGDLRGTDDIRKRKRQWARYPMGRATVEFIVNVSKEIPLKIEGFSAEKARHTTGIVTHAGKTNMDYIDHAVMLGRALKKYVPEYPMVALAVQGISQVNQDLLTKAGWHVQLVEDWGFDHCSGNCAAKFLGRWGDSFEKLNAFRLPFGKALFLDADTYVFNGDIKDVLEHTDLKTGQIAMVHDTCKRKGDKEEYNSGLMFYEPDVKRFAHMLELIALHSNGEVGDILDQRIINEEYRDQVVQLHDRFNCIDLIPKPGARGCPAKCANDTVVAHFTGMPKVTRAATGWLGLVRDETHNVTQSICAGTNHGCCHKYNDFFCEMTEEVSFLSAKLQQSVKEAGTCASPKTISFHKHAGRRHRRHRR